MSEQGSFEKDTLWRMCAQAARYWVIEHFLRTKELPDKPAVFFGYSVSGIDWGQEVLRGKRIKVTIEIEDIG